MSLILKHLHHFLFLSAIFIGTLSPAQSVLNTGDWYKFSIEKNGVYKINYDLLKKAGLDPSKTDPRRIKIYGNEGGMLPQSNAASRPDDLTELSIFVKGQDDGVFNKEDYILFYGEGADNFYFDLAKEIFYYERNLYAQKNFYFLTVGDNVGKRIQISQNEPGNFPIITEFDDFAYHEIDKHNELKSGRVWFGEKFDLETELTLKWDIENITENSPIKIVSDVMAQSGSGSTFNLFLNNQLIGEQYVLPISSYEYAPKGYQQRDTLIVNSNLVSAPSRSTLEFKYQYVKPGSGTSIGYLDFLLLSFKRRLALYGDQTSFLSASSVENSYSTFNISSSSDAITIWDITNSYDPLIQEFSVSNGIVSYSTATSSLKEFVVFKDNIDAPVYEEKLANQSLHGLATPNLIIVTHPDFQSDAERLALHRQQTSGWSTSVVTTNQVFNEFASGREDPTAIRDFTKYLYDKNPNELKALLLFGRGSYDYKDRLSNNTNFVPTYESRNSLSPLETYSSDDYFGFMEDNEGTWNEKVPQYHTLDIGVGRLPVRSVVEATNIVDKIIAYETSTSNFGNWRKQIVFVADDGDRNLHNIQADQLAEQIELNQPAFDTKKIYLDAFPQILQPAGEVSPETRNTIARSVDKGALIINYTGHGNERLWAHERILDDILIGSFNNNVYPLFVTATCEFGRQDDPAQISSAENCLFRNNSGAIGLVSTARPVNASTNFELNKAFYDALFQYEEGESLTLGEIYRRTKNNSISGVSNRNFSLLGDPSLHLAMPKLHTRVTEIVATGETTDTLKALSRVLVKGEVINDNNEKVTSFSGTLQAVLYDKETGFTTLGNENAPFNFKQWYNALYRGQAKVVDGDFQFEFVVPKNIVYQIGNGKLSLYAYDKNQFIDAGGAALDFVIGKSEPNPGNDITSPTVQLYMGDTTFRNGGITAPDTRLIARLTDANGINLSGYGIGNSLIAILDDSTSFVLNDYYQSDIDDFTRGWINYPLTGLVPGQHHITVKAWDTFNNPGEATLSFIVTDGNELVIEFFGNYPNPFSSKTTLFFTHNRSGDDLEAVVSIFDITGRELKTGEFLIAKSDYQVDLLEINTENDLGKNLKAGLYLARLVVRSLSNGSKSELVTKLILTN